MRNSNSIDKLWHGALRRPYKLSKSIDQGSGPLVVLLHGLGKSGQIWQPLADKLADTDVRLVALDLLGFGDSPKPVWPDYSIDQHARAVIATIKKLKRRGPVILVGHSLGCLVAAHIAWREPALVGQLILYEMPLYASEVNDSRRYKLHREARLAFYKSIVKNPERAIRYAGKVGRIASSLSGVANIPDDQVYAWSSTLKNSIIEQKTYQELTQLTLPIEIVYGTRDRLVIRANLKNMFAGMDNVSFRAVRARHDVTLEATARLAESIRRITAPLQ